MLWERMIRAAKLDATLYDEVEKDPNATSQALLVVLIVSVLAGIGGLRGGVMGFVGGLIFAIIGWAVWSLVMFWVGKTFFKGTATYGELLRCVGFAFTPRALGLLAFVPVVGGLIALIASIWALVAMIIAVREALDITTVNAVITAIIGAVIYFVVIAVLGTIFGLGAVGVGMMTP
ncbi:MAG: Yip1 family protein [Dehalococcoidia bacterium]|nr:Yip1 family protein [Dehalococcoidia bacterium]